MLTPVLNHRSRLELSWTNGRFTHKNGNHSTYVLISQDAVLSKQTRLFGHDINVVGRVCKIHNSINATSKSSPDALFEIFKFEFNGTITVSEVCPSNGTFVSQTYNFTTHATLKLPLVCALQSSLINCDSVNIHSNTAKEIHPTKYRMEIIEQHFEEEKININSTVFVRSKIYSDSSAMSKSTPFLDQIKWPVIGLLAAVTFLIFIGLIAMCLLKNNSKSGINVNVSNEANSRNDSPICNNIAAVPSAPSTIQSAPSTAQIEEAPPAYHSSVDIETLMDIPVSQRDPFAQRAITNHLSMRGKAQISSTNLNIQLLRATTNLRPQEAEGL